MPEILAGIDPSTSTGICILQDGKVIHTETWKLKKPGDSNGKAFVFYADSIRAVLIKFGVQAFAIEQKIQGGKIKSNANVHDMATYYQTRSLEEATRLNIEMVPVSIQSWRATFLPGKRPPTPPEPPAHILKTRRDEWQTNWKKAWWKQAALNECERRGLKVKGHDPAEAVGIADWLWKQRHPLGLDGANDLFALAPTPAESRTTLTLPGAKAEADRVFSKFGTDAAEDE
jgi:hypothetical protein